MIIPMLVKIDFAALGQVTVVAYDYAQNKKTALPEELKRRIAALEGRLPGDAAGSSALEPPRLQP